MIHFHVSLAFDCPLQFALGKTKNHWPRKHSVWWCTVYGLHNGHVFSQCWTWTATWNILNMIDTPDTPPMHMCRPGTPFLQILNLVANKWKTVVMWKIDNDCTFSSLDGLLPFNKTYSTRLSTQKNTLHFNIFYDGTNIDIDRYATYNIYIQTNGDSLIVNQTPLQKKKVRSQSWVQNWLTISLVLEETPQVSRRLLL